MCKLTKSIILLACLFILISTGSVWASATSLKNGGRVFVYDIGNENAKIHTYMSPYKALANATHIIELQDSLVIVDMQFVKTFADEFKAYAKSLDKPT